MMFSILFRFWRLDKSKYILGVSTRQKNMDQRVNDI